LKKFSGEKYLKHNFHFYKNFFFSGGKFSGGIWPSRRKKKKNFRLSGRNFIQFPPVWNYDKKKSGGNSKIPPDLWDLKKISGGKKKFSQNEKKIQGILRI